MRVLHTSVVTEDQIDHLGHMNVRFYGDHAQLGAIRLADSLDLSDGGKRLLVPLDRYARHHREQLLGAPLAVRGGVIEAQPDRVAVYEEILNTDTDVPAATFVVALTPVDAATRAMRPLDDDALERARAETVDIADYALPRSIDLHDDPTASAPTLDVVRERGLANREVRVVTDDLCDRDGFVGANRLPELVWGGTPLAGRAFEPFHHAADGTRLGWATMETRVTWSRLARRGERVQSFGAEVSVADKTTLSRHWLFAVDRGDLIGTFSVVNLAFDAEARRAVTIPAALRQRFEQRMQPDLAPIRVR